MKLDHSTYDLIVIGGGPSGMMCGGRAAELGARVLLLEKNKKLGKKLSLTGGGRCNITNAEFNVRAFLANFPEAKEFLFSPFSKFSAKDTFTFFENHGLPLVIEARKRAFPNTQKAPDVTRVMEKYVKNNRVEIKANTRVSYLKKMRDGNFEVKTKKGDAFIARNIAIATGNLAAPETGSTDDGFNLLKSLGHTAKNPSPNIVPLATDATWVHRLSGVTLSFMTIRFKLDGKIKLKKTGKILFTHFGVSGPLVLNSSFEVIKLLKAGQVEATIDMFPDTEENELDRRVWRLFEQNKNKKMKNVLPEMMDKAVAAEILVMQDINPTGVSLSEKPVNEVTKEERKKLVKKMKNLAFPIIGTLGFDKAVIADGGVMLEEVNFKNMTSRIHPNLYLLGDILNINRPSGGFSLQLCWTTGFVAGTSIGESIKTKK